MNKFATNFCSFRRWTIFFAGLTALVKRPSGAPTWNGPYLKGSVVPADPWGNPYLYRSPGQHGPYDIMSKGPTGQEGGTGDAAAITSWSKR